MLPLPEGLSSTDGLWVLPPGEDIEHVQLVRWRLSLPDGVGQWILLCRLAGEWLYADGGRVAHPAMCVPAANARSRCPQPFWVGTPLPACVMGSKLLPCCSSPLLACGAEALALVQAPPAGTPAGAARLAAELEELSAGLRLLATFCSKDPQTALELLHVELPTSSSAEGQRGPDLLTLAVQAVAVLAALPEPPAAVIGEVAAHAQVPVIQAVAASC